MKTEGNASSYLNKSVDKALSILELFNENEELTAQEIVQEMDSSAGSIYPTLHTLQKYGYLRRNDDKQYRLGLRFLAKAELLLERTNLRQQAEPHLKQLRDKTDATIHLGVRAGDEIVYIDKYDPSGPLRMYSAVGKKVPAHATGLGKALIAHLPSDDLFDLVDEKSLQKFTSNTIIDTEKLQKELQQIRNQGYAIDNAEHEQEIRCVAAPIFDHTHQVIAAVSLAVPAAQVNRSELESYIEPVKNTAQRITEKMGSNATI